MFGSLISPSDPKIPPECCLNCGQAENLNRCSSCKYAQFCNAECLKRCYASKHKKDCARLKRFASIDSRLKSRVQVKRSFSGASIVNPQNMVPSEVSNIGFWEGDPKSEMKSFLLGTHDRLGTLSPIRIIKSSSDVLQYIYSFLYTPRLVAFSRIGRLHNTEFDIVGSRIKLSPCAADHLSIVQSLTAAQLNARYPAACEERWGKMHGATHIYSQDGLEGIPLHALLTQSTEPCLTCGTEDGQSEQFFSFCMNRSVNADRVEHCNFCGKCFYYRPGYLKGCIHCGFGKFIIDDAFYSITQLGGMTQEAAQTLVLEASERNTDIVFKHIETARGCEIPPFADRNERGLAGEGYWGF